MFIALTTKLFIMQIRSSVKLFAS